MEKESGRSAFQHYFTASVSAINDREREEEFSRQSAKDKITQLIATYNEIVGPQIDGYLNEFVTHEPFILYFEVFHEALLEISKQQGFKFDPQNDIKFTFDISPIGRYCTKEALTGDKKIEVVNFFDNTRKSIGGLFTRNPISKLINEVEAYLYYDSENGYYISEYIKFKHNKNVMLTPWTIENSLKHQMYTPEEYAQFMGKRVAEREYLREVYQDDDPGGDIGGGR